MILTKKFRHWPTFSSFPVTQFVQMSKLSIKNLSKLAPFTGGALRFATQISPLLNLLNLFISGCEEFLNFFLLCSDSYFFVCCLLVAKLCNSRAPVTFQCLQTMITYELYLTVLRSIADFETYCVSCLFQQKYQLGKQN